MRPKNFILVLIVLSCLSLNAQIFSTAKVLSPLKFSAGIAPAYFNDNMALFMFFEGGIIKGLDFELKYGVVEGNDYVGADLEWRLYASKPFNFSLTTGFHVYGDPGADVAANLSFRIINNVALYTGLDSDFNFGNDVYVPLWLPVGVKINVHDQVAFIFEGEMPLNEESFAIIDGGVRVYF